MILKRFSLLSLIILALVVLLFAVVLVQPTSKWTNGNKVLIATTHNGRRGQKRVTVNSSLFGENIGTIILKTHYGCMS